jgi:hypothetical protein
LGFWVPRYRHRVIGTFARLNSSTPSAEGRTQRPLRPVWCRRTSFHLQRCSLFHQRITLCHTRFSRELRVLPAHWQRA